MTELFSIIVLTSIWVLGLTIITQEDMFLHSVRRWADRQGSWVEPIIRCHWCMPSLHSVVGYGFAYVLGVYDELTRELMIMYPLVIMGSSILNGLVWGWHKLVEAKAIYYHNVNDSIRKPPNGRSKRKPATKKKTNKK